ncbi:MAG: ABC transporter permease [Candidatus Heimdallarchaeota archaeon]|nr:ABC transporter permease [Candidatus Heimdallarchaeota archaeon]
MTTELQTEERLMPSTGKYSPSIFANVITLIVIALTVVSFIVIIVGSLSLIAGIKLFRGALDAGLLETDEFGNAVSFELTAENVTLIGYSKFTRLGIALIILGIIVIFPIKWLAQTYGRQSVEISSEGIQIKKWPRYKHYSNWDGILDITVKESESVFSNIIPNQNKIVIYTLDRSIGIEGMTLGNNREISSQLKAFGDSLEERVIDFGYGAQFSVIWRRMKRNKIGVFGAFLVAFFLFYSLTGALIGVIFPLNTLTAQSTEKIFIFWNPNFPNFEMINKPPSSSYWFGTDQNGRDIFSRLMFGAFYSILIAVISTIIQTFLGATIGAASGYIGGTFDQIIQRVTEVLNALPGLPILLLISTSITIILEKVDIEGAYYLAVYSIFALIGWGGIARIIRSEVLGLKNSEFIQAQIILGSTHGRIIRKHIIPNAMSTVIIFFTLGVAGNIIGVASLSFLGFGSNSTLVWGKDLSDAIGNQPTNFWWGTTFISLLLFLLVLGFNLMGDALRDALDPTLKK